MEEGFNRKPLWKKIPAWLYTALTGLVGFGIPICDLVRQPDVSLEGGSSSSTGFDANFAVTNRTLFSTPLKNVEFDCMVRKAEFTNNVRLSEFEMAVDGTSVIKSDPANFRCRVGPTEYRNYVSFFTPGKLKNAHLFVKVRYRLYGYNRETDPVEFTLSSGDEPHHWIMGQVIG